MHEGLNFGAHVVFLNNLASGADSVHAYRTIVDSVESGTHLAIVLRTSDGGPIGRLVCHITLRARVAAAERALLRAGGITIEARYGVYPSPEWPALVFELCGSAEAYARAHLISGPAKATTSALRRVLARWTGYDPSLGAVVVVGKKL